MATLVLQVAGTVIGTALGGPVGGAIGSALGAAAGSAIDQVAINAITGPQKFTGPRLSGMPGLGASEGAPIPRVYGRARIGGQLIWATRFEEEVSTRRQSGGKSVGRQARVTSYAYFANFAVGLCEGPIALVRRVYADGRELDLTKVTMRVHRGTSDQAPDPLIVAKEGAGNAPAYRNTAYVVFERLPLEDFGNRIPQLAFEVVRPVGNLASLVKGVNLIPGAGEFAYATSEITTLTSPGRSVPANRHQLTHSSDIEASLDALEALCPALESVSLVVAWFGDDLRCGHCTITPRVDQASKITSGGVWQVAGLTRSTAQVVSQVSGVPAYGGTPSDISVLQAIAAIKARGWKVTLHPFVMMDVPAGNNLPDPWTGASSQPVYPWRGRITVSPAPGRPGTPDNSAAASTQIAAFIGTASPAHFTVVNGFVNYSGPAEWSLRRFLLHYAKLATIAGGVDGFLLGSEFRSLSIVRAAPHVYPFANALAGIAADIRAILGANTNITYAADWTEYGAHVPAPGEVGFPLDALWAHSAIDCVGIDWYPPLTDWRDGVTHLDAASFNGPNDPAYLASRVAGGEAFDFYYASEADRQAQIRTPITDGAYNKPWLYRPKDLVGWWSNPHIRRSGGVETTATSWVPQSKPIRLMELGCPAVDRGGNAPNVFPDAKSSEGGLPFFSRGFRDDLTPLRLIEATLRHYDPALGASLAANPVSNIYGGRMLDASRIHLWAWDARPFPAFPDLATIWADAPNYETGHWLAGRLEAQPIEKLIAAMLADFEIALPATIEADMLVDGYVIDRPMSLRAALEPLSRLMGLEMRIEATGLRVFARNRAAAIALDPETFVADRDRPLLESRRAQESEIASEFALTFSDAEGEYRAASVTARRATAIGKRVANAETALIARRAEMARLADIRLRDASTGAETIEFALPLSQLALEPGDVVALPQAGAMRDFEILRILDTQFRRIEARAIDRTIFEAPPPLFARPRPAAPAIAGPPATLVLDLPPYRDDLKGLQHIAAFADPWQGGMVIWRSGEGATYDPFATIPISATMGELLDPLPPGPASRWDRAANFRVKLYGHALESKSDNEALDGANAFAVKAPSGAIEVIIAASATLIGERTYRLSRLLRGLGGGEAEAALGAPAGSIIVKLDSALAVLNHEPSEIGRLWRYRVAASGVDHASARAVSFEAAPSPSTLRPLSPVRARVKRESAGLRINWIRRSRIGGDAWDLFEIPLGEDSERYEVDIRNNVGAVLRTLSVTEPTALYTNAEELADFGMPQSSLSLAIAQISATIGRGRALVATLPVT